MTDKPKNAMEKPIEISQFPLLNALKVRYNTEQWILARLTRIEQDFEKAPPGVQSAVVAILETLDPHGRTRNTEIMTAAIMAINPKMTIAAANDEKRFQNIA